MATDRSPRSDPVQGYPGHASRLGRRDSADPQRFALSAYLLAEFNKLFVNTALLFLVRFPGIMVLILYICVYLSIFGNTLTKLR
jgi:hypothetical protein